MLVLTRKKSETIHIGDNIVIKVLRTGHGTVKLGIDAPADVRILRAELCDDCDAPPNSQPEEDEEACEIEGQMPVQRMFEAHPPVIAV